MSWSNEKRKSRLRPVLAQLDAAGEGTFLDLCELLLLYAETMPQGMIKWTHPRVTVHIKHKKPEKKP